MTCTPLSVTSSRWRLTAATFDGKVTEDVWNENPSKEKQEGNWRRVGSAAGTLAGLCLLFSTLQKRCRSAEDKQCQVSHQHQQEGKHAGDISQAVKRLHSDAAAALFHSVFQLLRVEKRNDSITAYMFIFPVYLPELSVTAKLILQTSRRKKFSSALQL